MALIQKGVSDKVHCSHFRQSIKIEFIKRCFGQGWDVPCALLMAIYQSEIIVALLHFNSDALKYLQYKSTHPYSLRV